MQKGNYSSLIKKKAQDFGFDSCGISKADFLAEEAPKLEQWLTANMHGQMHFMSQNFNKRLDPRLLFDGCKSVISLILNYYPEQEQAEGLPKISRYAYGRDYHKVLKGKCKKLIEELQAEIGDFNARVFVDSAPIMDKVWAKKSGLGWIGKHSNLINRQIGSYFFIAEILCDLDLEADASINDYCGTCTKCIDACPTDAIVEPYVVDGSKCISYLTIELKEQIPSTFKNQYKDWIFGCDICQEVCPWNRFAKPNKTQDLAYNSEKLDLTWGDWEEITEEIFDKKFAGSPLKRAKIEGLKRNLHFVKPE